MNISAIIQAIAPSPATQSANDHLILGVMMLLSTFFALLFLSVALWPRKPTKKP